MDENSIDFIGIGLKLILSLVVVVATVIANRLIRKRNQAEGRGCNAAASHTRVCSQWARACKLPNYHSHLVAHG